MYVVFIFTKSFLIGHITFQGTFGNLSFFVENKNSSHLDFCNIDSVSKGYALYSTANKCFPPSLMYFQNVIKAWLIILLSYTRYE